MAGRAARFILAIAVAGLGWSSGERVLLQVQVVSRHGARTQLTKDSATLSEGGALLTAVGAAQMNALGEEIRATYVGPESSQLGPAVEISPEDIWVVSSDLDRTITSAMEMASSLWPKKGPNQTTGLSGLVPVHATDAADDVGIRAYMNCPSFTADLPDLYGSQEFADKRDESINFLSDLAFTYPSLAVEASAYLPKHVPLEKLWNAFDSANVEGATNGPEYTQLRALTSWVEHRKFGHDFAGTRLGYNLWEEILGRIHSLQAYHLGLETAEDDPPKKFVHYSAHYPTILGLLGGLDLFSYNTELAEDGEDIPDYAAAVIIEAWTDTEVAASESAAGSVFMKLRFKFGPSAPLVDAPYLSMGPMCEAASEQQGFPAKSCPMITLSQVMSEMGDWPGSKAEWCESCVNFDARVCWESAQHAEAAEKTSWAGKIAAALGAGLLAGMLAGICFAAGVCTYWHKRDVRDRGGGGMLSDDSAAFPVDARYMTDDGSEGSVEMAPRRT